MFGLIFSCMAALAATLWGVSSCRFVFVDFISDRGDLSDFYLDPTPDGAPVKFRHGVGLFTWLQPFDDGDWSKGQCTGYTQLGREHFSDNYFEVARVFSVLSVLGGIGMTCWTLFLACISLGKFQIWMLSTILGFLAIFVGLTFLILPSSLCTDLVSYQDDEGTNEYTTECTLDQGGLVTIAGAVLWSVASLISIIYIKTPETDMRITQDGQITNAFQQRRKERQLKQMLAEQKREQSRNHRGIASVTSGQDGGTEVQLDARTQGSMGEI